MPVVAAASDSAGNIWLGGPDSIVEWKKGSAKVYRPSVLKDNQHQGGVMALAVDSDGSLLVGMTKDGPGLGLQRFRDRRFTPVMAPGFDGSQHRIVGLFVDHHQALWVGTRDDGLYRLYQGDVEHFTSQDGLSGNTVESFYEDSEGSYGLRRRAASTSFAIWRSKPFLGRFTPRLLNLTM